MSRKKEAAEDREAIAALRSRADKSIAVLEKALARNGTGRYLVLRASEDDLNDRIADPRMRADPSSS